MTLKNKTHKKMLARFEEKITDLAYDVYQEEMHEINLIVAIMSQAIADADEFYFRSTSFDVHSKLLGLNPRSVFKIAELMLYHIKHNIDYVEPESEDI